MTIWSDLSQSESSILRKISRKFIELWDKNCKTIFFGLICRYCIYSKGGYTIFKDCRSFLQLLSTNSRFEYKIERSRRTGSREKTKKEILAPRNIILMKYFHTNSCLLLFLREFTFLRFLNFTDSSHRLRTQHTAAPMSTNLFVSFVEVILDGLDQFREVSSVGVFNLVKKKVSQITKLLVTNWKNPEVITRL